LTNETTPPLNPFVNETAPLTNETTPPLVNSTVIEVANNTISAPISDYI
jgi:hypothetical protein